MTVDELAARLHGLAIHLLRRVRRVDVAAGLSAARLSALSVLVFGGSRTLGELASAEQVTAPTMTRLVAALEADGLVRRSRDRRDGRVSRMSATRKGRRVLEAGRRRRVELVKALLTGLSAEERERVESAVEVLERELSAAGP